MAVLEFNSRESYQFSIFLKHLKEKNDEGDDETEESNNNPSSIIAKDFILLDPILNLIKNNLNIKIVFFYRRNYYLPEKVQELISNWLKIIGNKVECEVANSSGDLWFLLSKNVENFDIIHIFSSEKQGLPRSVLKFLEEKNCEKLLKLHYTGWSFLSYSSKLNIVLNSLSKEIISNQDYTLFQNQKSRQELVLDESEIKDSAWEYNNNALNTKDKSIWMYTYYIFSK